VKQINLEYKVKNERLQKLHSSARAMLAEFDWTLQHVPREKNKKADTLSKQALTKGVEK
jgi:ribonuclease HI